MKKNYLLVAALATLTTTSAMAENKKGEDVDSIKSVSLQGVQVVSTRAGKKTPMAFTNIDKRELKRVNIGQDIPFLLSTSSSVTTTSDAGNAIGYTSIRVRGTDATRINITANGIPINDSESNGLYWVNMPDFASSVETMQIQRGVGTSTNGSGAFGATVNMQTENIGLKPYGGIDLSAGSYYSHKETFRFGTGLIDGHWGFQGRLSNIGSKGYLDRASSKLNSYFLQGGYFSDNTVVKFITFNGNEQTYHAWNYTSKAEQEKYGRRYNSCGAIKNDNGDIIGYYDNQTDNYHQQHYQLLWNQVIDNNWNLNAALHYTRGDGYYEEYKSDRAWADYGLAIDDASDNINDTYFSSIHGDLVRQKKMANDFYGAIASLNYNNRKGLQATIGGGWNKYDGDHFGKVIWAGTPYKYYIDKDGNEYKDANGKTKFACTNFPSLFADFEYYRNNAKKTDGNIYGKVSYDIVDGLSAYVDLQYRHVGYKMQNPGDYYGANKTGEWVVNKSFDFFNPKAGLFFDIDKNNKVYASVAVAHKEPTRNDYEDNIGTDLKAERLIDWEAGYKFASPTFSAGANFYYMTYRDQFVLTGEINSIGEAIAKNAGKSYRMGLELEAAWKPVDWFRWDLNATFSKNRAKDWTVDVDGVATTLGDTHLSFSPDVIFNNIFTFTYKGLNASVRSQYVGEQYMTNTGFKSYTYKCKEYSMMLDDFFTTNIDLSYTFKLRGLKSVTIGCTVYNVFSAEYDNNGWAAPYFTKDSSGKLVCTSYDENEAGFAPSAPINAMAHLSFEF